MTLIGIGPFWLYRSIFFLFSHTSKVKQADETLRRIYNRNCKTLSINRAGKHHSGFYPSSCPRNCSLLSSNKLDTHNLIHQSINLGGLFFLHCKMLLSLNLGRSNFCWITKEATFHVVSCSRVNVCGSINISANYVAKCWPILLHFRLGNRSSCCFIYIHPVLRKNGKEHPLARAYTLFCIFNFDLFVFMLLASPNWKHVQHLYRIGFVALFGSLGCLAIFFETSSNTATPRNIKHRQRQSLNDHGFVQYQFLIGCLKMIVRM